MLSLRVLRGSAAEADEDGEGIPGHGLPDELPAGLDFTVETPGELLRLMPGRSAHDQVIPAARHLEALLFEPVGKRVGVVVRLALDPDLPGGIAVRAHLLLPRLLPRLVVPTRLAGEPVLDADEKRLDPGVVQLGLDDRLRLAGLEPRRRVDEDRLAVAGDRQPFVFELLGELSRSRAEVEAEARQEPARALSLEFDPDPPVVARHAGCRLPAKVTDSAQSGLTRVTIPALSSKTGAK